MSQSTFILDPSATDNGLQYEVEVNTALQALASCNAGASAPATTYPNQLWADTNNNLMKQRNNANNAWVVIGALGVINQGLVPDLNATATGSANAYAVTVNALYALTAGMKLWFKANFTCTGDGTTANTPTLAVNGGATTKILKYGVSGLGNGDIISGGWVCVIYDGTYWQIVSQLAGLGEYQSANNVSGTSLTSPTWSDVAQLTNLPAGDWDVSGIVEFLAGAGTTFTALGSMISNTANPSFNTLTTYQTQLFLSSQNPIQNKNILPTMVTRVQLSSPTTIYLGGISVFSGGTMTAYGMIQARRMN